jgi:serine/threonine protein kinase
VLLRCGNDAAKADIWACGVVLFTLVAGLFPFNYKDTSLYHMIRQGRQLDDRCIFNFISTVLY